jgi:hypothetical protein
MTRTAATCGRFGVIRRRVLAVDAFGDGSRALSYAAQ